MVGWIPACGFIWRFSAQCLMHPVDVVIVLKLIQLLLQIAFVPEKNLVQVFPAELCRRAFR